MNSVVFAVLLNLGVPTLQNCPEPVVTSESNDPWNKIDQRNFESAIVRCGQKFEKSPCLKRFVKRDVQVYWAICGRPE